MSHNSSLQSVSNKDVGLATSAHWEARVFGGKRGRHEYVSITPRNGFKNTRLQQQEDEEVHEERWPGCWERRESTILQRMSDQVGTKLTIIRRSTTTQTLARTAKSASASRMGSRKGIRYRHRPRSTDLRATRTVRVTKRTKGRRARPRRLRMRARVRSRPGRRSTPRKPSAGRAGSLGVPSLTLSLTLILSLRLRLDLDSTRRPGT